MYSEILYEVNYFLFITYNVQNNTTIENLNKACPNHLGDWYFTGNYPTSGGNKVANRSFMNYVDGIKGRAY